MGRYLGSACGFYQAFEPENKTLVYFSLFDVGLLLLQFDALCREGFWEILIVPAHMYTYVGLCVDVF